MGKDNFDQLADYVSGNADSFYRLAYSYVRNEADAMDIVQNAVCKALENYRKLRNSSFLKTWFYRILVNESINFLRKNAKDIPFPEEYLELGSYEELGYEAFDGDDRDLTEAIAKLPVAVQSVIKLRFYEDFSLKEIAEITDSNLNTVKARLYRGLEMLRTEVTA